MKNEINKRTMNYIIRELNKCNELVIKYQPNIQEILYLRNFGINVDFIKVQIVGISGYPMDLVFCKYTR